MGAQAQLEELESTAMARREAERNLAAQIKDEAELTARLSFEAEMRRVQRESDARMKSILAESALNLKLAAAADEAFHKHKQRADDAEVRIIELEHTLAHERKVAEEEREQQSVALSKPTEQKTQATQTSGESPSDTMLRDLRAQLDSKELDLQQAQAHIERLLRVEQEGTKMICSADASTEVQSPSLAAEPEAPPCPGPSDDEWGPSFTRWIHQLQLQLERASRRATVAESLNKQLQAKVDQLTNTPVTVRSISNTDEQSVPREVEGRKEKPKSFQEQLEQLVREREALRLASPMFGQRATH
jgi:hypothetical protein